MDPSDVLLTLLTAVFTAYIGSVHWRLGRVERRLTAIEVALGMKPDRDELTAIWEELRKKPDREELTAVWEELRKKPDREELTTISQELRRNSEELRKKPDREELTSVRADLTQIALAVGATRPRASEG